MNNGTFRRARIALVGFAALMLMPGIVRADDVAVKKELIAASAKSVAAIKKKDVKTFMSYIADDYQGKLANGMIMTRQQLEQQTTAMTTMVKSIDEYKYTINKLKVKGNEATAETNTKLTMKIADPQGKLHTIFQDSRMKEVYVKVGKMWKQKYSEQLPGGKMEVDGKPFMPGARAPKKP